MRLKRLGLALLASMVLSAIAANSALATAEETNGFWYKGETVLTESLAVTCSQVGEATLSTTVGKSNTPLKLKATGTTCPGGKIFNESSKAKATGKIKFTGVSVVEPAGCSVAGGAIETEALKAQVYMEGSHVLVRFAPASGTEFAEVEVTGCAIANAYPTSGVLFGEAVNATNVLASAQKVKFSSTINSEAGGSLTFGGHAATLTGETSIALTGGGEFKAVELGGGLSCMEVTELQTGFYNEAGCGVKGGTLEFTHVVTGGVAKGGTKECDVIADGNVDSGVYYDPNCTSKVPVGKFEHRQYILVT